ncbi:DNA polymerase I [Candidatus Bipolaricaulota bacterium]|nr:DNA polymerase I [Candidatus Bipolaricaulota bacterium]
MPVSYEDLFGWPATGIESRLLVIDGHAMAYRAYFAIRELRTHDRLPVNGVFGFWKFLSKALRTYPSSHVSVAFDAGGRTFRHRLYDAYKATRSPMPEDLAVQLPIIHQLLEVLGVPIWECEGIEADDLVATIVSRAESRGIRSLIVSSDKDLAQLVNEEVRLLRPLGRGGEGFEECDPQSVRDRYGVLPERIVDWLSLVGDSSDNIPGVPGIGEKTAVKLLQQFGSLDALLEKSEEIRNARIRNALEEHRETLKLARRLVTLDRDVYDPLRLEQCRPTGIDDVGLIKLLDRLEFRSVIDDLGLRRPAPEQTIDVQREEIDYRTVLTIEQLDDVFCEASHSDVLSVDLETTSRDAMKAEIVGVSISWKPCTAAYIPVGHRGLEAPAQLPLPIVLAALTKALRRPGIDVIGQNLKYDLMVLHRAGIEMPPVGFDAMIASHLTRPEQRQHNLSRIALDVLNYRMVSFEDVAGKDGEFAAVPVEQAMMYACEDADVVSRVRAPLLERLEAMGLSPLFRDVELPLVRVLARMELRGIRVDSEELDQQRLALREELEIIEADLAEIAGHPFNPASTKQVAEVLFDELGLPILERTKTGPSTSAQVLAELAVQHPLPGKLMEYRELRKLLTTYIEKLPLCINAKTGRVHTSFHQTSTATGRLSSSDPNLQNIPVRTPVGERIRRAFVAEPGFRLVGADYSQIELRLLAHLSEDKRLIDAFMSGEDLHRLTAAHVFGMAPERVTDKLRSAAKRINFGIIYGISPFGLARQLGTSNAEAKTFIDRFDIAYPRAKEFMSELVERATRTGYAETILGRRRPLPDLGSRNVAARNYDRRNAINTPIQGSAADLIKLAMLRLDTLAGRGGLPAEMLLQIHDELVFEVADSDVDRVTPTIRREMESVMALKVPLEVTIASGPNWSSL